MTLQMIPLKYCPRDTEITRGCLRLPLGYIDIIAVSNGGKIELYSTNQTGKRTKLTAADIRNGNLEFMIRGHISN